MPEPPVADSAVAHTLTVPTGWAPDIVGAVADPDTPQGIALRCVHYDTPGLRLAAWGAALVRYVGATDEQWLLLLGEQFAAGAGGVQVSLSGPGPGPGQGAGAVPAALADALTALVRGQPLHEVASREVLRSGYHLLDCDGSMLARLVLEAPSSTSGSGSAHQELRVVSGSADEGPPQSLLDALREDGATPAAPLTSAAVRGGSSVVADVAEPATVGPQDPAGAAVQVHLQTYVRRFLRQDVRVRLDLPDSVHQMRVAARRMRSALKVFGPLVRRRWARHLRDELGWAASQLGHSRDIEVLLDRLDRHAAELPGDDERRIREHIDPVLREQAASGRTGALAALHSQRHRELLDALAAAAGEPHLTRAAQAPSAAVLPPLFEASYQKLAAGVDELSLQAPADQWHRTRISAKQARYAADALAPVFGEPAKALATALSEITELLGEHQDAVIAQQTLRMLADRFDGPTGFSLGLLHSHEAQCERSARLGLAQRWPLVADLQARTRWG